MNINPIKNISYCAFLLSFLFSCSSSEDENSGMINKNAVHFIGSITRATASAFEEGDTISVFAFKDASGFASESYAANKRYVYTGSQFVASNTENTIVYPADGSSLSFHAIYPYTEFSGASFTFNVESNQNLDGNYTRSDLMTASTISTNDLAPSLRFTHRLCNVVFNLSFDEVPSGAVHVAYQHITTSVSADMIANTFKGVGGQDRMVNAAANGTNSYKAVLPPQTISAGTELAVITTEAGDSYTWKMPQTVEWKSGIQYSYDLHIDKTGTITFMSTIDSWNQSSSKMDREMLIGKWAWLHDKGWERYGGHFEEWDDDYTTPDNLYFFFFNADGTGHDSYDSAGLDVRDEYTWELQEDKLILNVKGDASLGEKDEIQIAKIMKLTSTELELEYSEPDYYSYVTLEKR